MNEAPRSQEPRREAVLVTGSAGLIGQRVVDTLTDKYPVIGFDVIRPDEIPEGVEWTECDLTDDQSVKESLEKVRDLVGPRLASVVHLAAYYDFSGEPSPMYDELTVEGTRRLLRGLQDFEVGQFQFSSSLLVMKPAEKGEALDENCVTQAEWAYPESKLEAEKVVADERGDTPAVILRLAGVYDEDGHSLPIGQQIKRIYEKDFESYFYPGDAECGQSFVHLEDAVECIRLAIERRSELGDWELFLVGEPDVMCYEELQDRIGELLHDREWPTIRIPKVLAKVGAWAQDKMAGEGEEPFIKPWMVDLADAHYPVDVTRAQQKLGWTPRHRLRSTLPEMLRRMKNDPEAWFQANGLD